MRRGSRFFFFQAEDGIRDLVRSRGLGDVYKRQGLRDAERGHYAGWTGYGRCGAVGRQRSIGEGHHVCLLYTSDAADERSSVDLGGRRIIKKKRRYIVKEEP